MRVSAVSAGTFGSTGQAPRDAQTPEPKAESRALVVVRPPEATEETSDRPMAYRDAPFLAQLIATKAQVPQTRAKRRAEPAEAVAAYRAASALANTYR